MAKSRGRRAASRRTLMEREFQRVRAFVFEPYTLFRAPPMAGRYVNVTAQGYRQGGSGTPWPPDTSATNLFVFGGSTTFGYEVADQETIPAQLAVRLAELLPDRRVAVYNFASPNYASVQERIRLEQLLLDGYVPRVAIFIDGFDEFLWPYYAPVMLQPFVEAIPRPSTSQLTSVALRAILRRLAPGWLEALVGRDGAANHRTGELSDPATVLDRYLANRRLVEAVCERFGVQPLFVWQPVPCYHYDGADQLPQPGDPRVRGPLLEGIRRGYELMSTRRGVDACDEDFLWLGDLQSGRTDLLYADADHYTAAFSGEIAARIAQQIHDRGWVRST